MKRILLSLMMVVATLLSATATETVIDCTSLTWAGVAEKLPTISAKSGAFTITLDKGAGITAPTQNGTSKDVRAYAKNTITVVSTGGNISSAVFEISVAGLKRLTTSTVNTGSLSYNMADDKKSATVTWAGSATSFVITVGDLADLGTETGKAGQICFNSITVNTGEAPAVATPVISPKGGKFFEAQSVTLSCPTPNASIFYTLDGTDPSKASTSYSAPIAISKIGTTTLKAIAFVGADKSSIASETYEIAEPKTVANIAAFLATCPTEPATGEIVTINSPVTVLFHGVSKANSYLFVKDETGALQVFSAGKVFPQTYAQGNVIPAGIMGSVGFFGKAPQMVPALDSFLAPTGTIEVKPLSTPVEEVSADMLNQLVMLSNVTLAETTISDATGAIEYYNRFDGVIIPTDLTAKYDVTGIVNSYNGKLQIYPTAINISGGVNDITNDETSIVANYGNINITVNEAATATIINGAGQVVGQQEVVAGENTIEVAAGFYIVKVGNTVAKVIVK